MKIHCRHENKDSDLTPLEIFLDGDVLLYVKKISKLCGYSKDVVIGVMLAIAIEGRKELKTKRPSPRKPK